MIGIFDDAWRWSRHSIVTLVLSSSEPALRYSKYIIFAKTIIDKKLKTCSLESAVCALEDCLNPIFLSGVLHVLLFNKFLRVLCITMCLRVKVTYIVRRIQRTAPNKTRYFPY